MIQSIRQFSLLILLFICVMPARMFAGHILGGEIYWDCIKNGSDQGKYIFYLNLYRKCGGSPMPSAANIVGSNGITISASVFETRDLTPTCWDSSSAISCLTSTNGDAIEQYLYQSQPVTLTGTPPANGWTFSWTSCCRPMSPITDNLSVQGGSYYVKAKMFPYTPLGSLSPKSANECFDSSPRFVQHPTALICKGIAGYMDYATSDIDADQRTYTFESGQTSSTNLVTYATHLNTNQTTPRANGGGFVVPSPGFSADMPLPWSHTNMDVKNVPALLDTTTGMIKFHSYTPGIYLVTVKINSFRHGQKIAEINREMYIKIANCAGTNTQPAVTLMDTSHSDTIAAKDTVLVGELYNITINAADVEFNSLNPVVVQQNKLSVVSPYIGDSVYNTTGCLVPPCARIDSSRSTMTGDQVESTGGLQAYFEWQTHCNHMQGAQVDSNGNFYRNYLFKFDVTDDFCPIPATTTKLLTITVMDTVHPYPEIVKIDNNGSNLEIIWNNAGGTFPGYNVIRDSGYTSNPVMIDSILSTNAHYIDSGKGGSPHHYAYQLQNRSRSSCVPGKWYQSTALTASAAGGRNVELNWNGHIPFDAATEIWYLVYSKSAGGNWVFEDSVQLGYDSLVLSQQPCDEWRYYRVEAHYDNGFLSISNQDSFRIDHVHPIINGQNGTWQAPLSQSYSWYMNGQLISGAVSSVYPMVSGGYVQVAMNDSNGCPVLTDSLLALSLQVSHKKAATLDADWDDFDPSNMPANSWYRLERKDTSGNWILIDSIPFGTDTYRDSLILCDASIPYRVIALYENGSMVYSNADSAFVPTIVPSITVSGNMLSATQASTYQWLLDDVPIAGAITQNWPAQSNGSYSIITTDTNNCMGVSNEILITWTGESVSELTHVRIFPNPVNDHLILEWDQPLKSPLQVQLLDVAGKVVTEMNFSESSLKNVLDVSAINKGMYVVRLSTRNDQHVLKILKK